MSKRAWEQWGIPTIIGLALLIAGVYLNAWATGVQLRPPFTLGWIKSVLLLSVQMPLWMILVVLATVVVTWLVLRRRNEMSEGTATRMIAEETKIEEQIQVPAQTPPSHPVFPADGTDGSHRNLVRYIMYGRDQLLAYTTTRDGQPGTSFLVVRQRPDQEPQYTSTPDRETANARWAEWYRAWKQRGFGGASGNFDGDPPF